LGDGGGAGGSGSNREAPGGSICAEAISPKASTATTVQIMIDEWFMADILFADLLSFHEECLVILPANGN
jgi:hypothetical protein